MLEGLDPQNVIRPFTYVVMRMGDIALVPYYRPGMTELLSRWLRWRPGIQAFYWLIMGRSCAGREFAGSANTEELEETAKRGHVSWRTPDSLVQHRKLRS
ncbi:hypothetical protein KCP76_04280 [Salmonella enterica subsp. enterica serovar Weltevreden]|nr:hypothetical protein KCP76_04280 [Salmonella enterica subsp. enterica serovar Weltevreden]